MASPPDAPQSALRLHDADDTQDLRAALRADAPARKARPVVLVPGMTASRAFAVVAAECLDHWRTNEALLLDSRAMPHLHQTRVGIRRLRSSFSLFRPVLRDVDGALDVAHRLRRLALPFGHARDLDVILAGGALHGHQVHHVAALSEAREETYDDVLHRLRSKRWARTGRALDDVVARARRHPFDDTRVDTLAARALEKRWRRVAGVHDRVADMSPADRHRVRIEAKKLRYGCEFFAGLYADADGPTVVTDDGDQLTGPLAYAWYVEEVQSALGAVNDHHTAGSLLRSVGAGAPAVDEAALVEAGVAACHRLAAVEPFWR